MSTEAFRVADSRVSIEISVVVPITERFEVIEDVFTEYVKVLEAYQQSYEIIYVLDGEFPQVLATLKQLKSKHEHLTIVQFPKSFGEATAISAGFETSSGKYVMILPPYRQVKSSALEKLLDKRNDADVICGARVPRIDSMINRIQTRLFGNLVAKISGVKLEDAGCSVRLFKREVLEELELYGEFHRFLPLLAYRRGFSILECELGQAQADRTVRVYHPGLYLRRLLDILIFYFLARFTKKPFRFFGLIGITTTVVGLLATAVVVGQRIIGDTALADRPAFLLGTLLIVFGFQIISVGLIAEIVIFTHARDLREYSVRKIH